MLVAKKRNARQLNKVQKSSVSTGVKYREVHLTNSKSKNNLRSVLRVFICFVMGFFIMYRYTQINENSLKIAKLKKELNNLNTLNSQMQIDIEKSVDLKVIEKYAYDNLGMRKPEDYQIKYVKLEKTDFNEMADKSLVAMGDNSSPVFIKMVTEFIKYLY